MKIDPRLLDEIGMIRGSHDSIAHTVEYAMVYNMPELLEPIHKLIVPTESGYEILRSYKHLKLKESGKPYRGMSRDHIFKLKIACVYFKTDEFDYFFNSLPKSFKKFSEFDKGYLTPDLKAFVDNKFKTWSWYLLFYVIVMLWSKMWLRLAGQKHSFWHYHQTKSYVWKDGEKINSLKDIIQNWKYFNEQRKVLKWGLLEYWVCRCMKSHYPGYVLLQTCLAIYVSKVNNLPARIVKKAILNYTWQGNTVVRLLLGYRAEDVKFPMYIVNIWNNYIHQESDTHNRLAKPYEEYKYKVNYDMVDWLRGMEGK